MEWHDFDEFRISDEQPLRDGSLASFCAARSTALQEIELRAADFVAKVDIFKAEQVAFRAAVQNASEKMRQELESPAFVKEVGDADKTKKIGVLKKKFSAFAGSLKSGPAYDILKRAMDALQSSATLLTDTVQTNLALFEEYLSKCNQMLLGTGIGKEYLLDICPQNSGTCIERPTAGHVGCCCGINPVVSQTAYIDGRDSSDVLSSGGYVALGRRLAEGASINVCAEAASKSKVLGRVGWSSKSGVNSDASTALYHNTTW